MIIRIENLGPVKKVDIDLSKPMMIFTGLNGTGKTYVSYVIYMIYKLFVYNKDFLNWKEMIKSSVKERKGALDIDQLYKVILDHLKLMNGILNVAFGVDFFDDLVKNTKLTLLTTKKQFIDYITSAQVEINAENIYEFIKRKGTIDFYIAIKGGNIDDGIIANYLVVKSLLFGSIVEEFEPSDRSGLFTYNKEINIGLNNYNDAKSKLTSAKKLKYPIAITRFLADLEEHLKETSVSSKYGCLADEIEKEILHGHLTVSDTGDVFYKKEGMDKEIPLALSSSGVKTICSIILFLRYSAMECNMIIIDEPEINLHPKYQVLMARVLSKLVNKGVQLIINTHSDYIVREINNMIMLASINNEEKVKQLGYNKEMILSKDDVAPYLFDFDDQGNVVGKEIEVTKTGFSIDIIDEVINDQVTTSQNIYEIIEGL